jgi:LacI family transcriptional regulator
MIDRLKGYQKGINRGLQSSVVLHIPFGTEPLFASKKIKQFIEQNPQMDAILFATNYLAISGLTAIRELGLNIPAKWEL